MAAIVFCCVAVLAAYCALGLLPEGASSGSRGFSAGSIERLLLSLGRLLNGAPGAVNALAGIAEPFRGAAAVGRLFFGPSAGNGDLPPDKGRAAAAVVLLMGAGSAAGATVSLSPFGLLMGAAAPVVLLAVAGDRARKANANEVERAMPEVFGALSIALGSGHSLAQAMRYVGIHSREPIRTEFMRVGFAIDCGFSATEALDGLIRRLHAPGLDMVALALKVSQRTGAPLKDLLAEAARLAGERNELQRTLDVKTSQARMSARLVAGMPVAMIVFLVLLSSDFRKGAATVTGAFCVLVALGLNAVAWMIIRKIMKVDL